MSKIYYLRIPKLLSNKILLTYFNLSESIHKTQFNMRYPVHWLTSGLPLTYLSTLTCHIFFHLYGYVEPSVTPITKQVLTAVNSERYMYYYLNYVSKKFIVFFTSGCSHIQIRYNLEKK